MNAFARRHIREVLKCTGIQGEEKARLKRQLLAYGEALAERMRVRKIQFDLSKDWYKPLEVKIPDWKLSALANSDDPNLITTCLSSKKFLAYAKKQVARQERLDYSLRGNRVELAEKKFDEARSTLASSFELMDPKILEKLRIAAVQFALARPLSDSDEVKQVFEEWSDPVSGGIKCGASFPWIPGRYYHLKPSEYSRLFPEVFWQMYLGYRPLHVDWVLFGHPVLQIVRRIRTCAYKIWNHINGKARFLAYEIDALINPSEDIERRQGLLENSSLKFMQERDTLLYLAEGILKLKQQ